MCRRVTYLQTDRMYLDIIHMASFPSCFVLVGGLTTGTAAGIIGMCVYNLFSSKKGDDALYPHSQGRRLHIRNREHRVFALFPRHRAAPAYTIVEFPCAVLPRHHACDGHLLRQQELV